MKVAAIFRLGSGFSPIAPRRAPRFSPVEVEPSIDVDRGIFWDGATAATSGFWRTGSTAPIDARREKTSISGIRIFKFRVTGKNRKYRQFQRCQSGTRNLSPSSFFDIVSWQQSLLSDRASGAKSRISSSIPEAVPTRSSHSGST